MPSDPLIRKNQSAEYRKLRDELLEAEAALVAQRERVAEMRRGLGRGTRVDTDYVFREGPADLSRNQPSDFVDTRLSELFRDGVNELVVDHMMFAPEAESGCPMCSMWADGYDAVGRARKKFLGASRSLSLRDRNTVLAAWLY